MPVQIGLDGVLFDDLSFYGSDKLGSRRTLTLSEFEARRDRKYFKSLVAEGGPERLRREILESMTHSADRPTLDVQMVRGGRATNFEPEKQVQFAFLRLPDSPVDPMGGMARIAGNEARAPRLEVKNRSDRPITISRNRLDSGGSRRPAISGGIGAGGVESGAGAKKPDSGERHAEIPHARRTPARD